MSAVIVPRGLGFGDMLRPHPERHYPLSRPWLRGLAVETVIGDMTHDQAQQLTAYYVWHRRWLAELPGDALQDWLESGAMLNEAAQVSELPVLPW